MEQALIEEIVAKVVALVRAKMIAGVPKKRVLMLFSGASTGYVVGMDTIRMLTQANHDLTVFMTASATACCRRGERAEGRRQRNHQP